MSSELAKEFIKRISTNEEFAKKIIGCRDIKYWMTFTKEFGSDTSIDEITVGNIREALAELKEEGYLKVEVNHEKCDKVDLDMTEEEFRNLVDELPEILSELEEEISKNPG